MGSAAEAAAMACLERACSSVLAGLPTSLRDDERRAGAAAQDLQLAVQWRQGYKRCAAGLLPARLQVQDADGCGCTAGACTRASRGLQVCSTAYGSRAVISRGAMAEPGSELRL